MQEEPRIAFVARTEPAALEIRVNFGIFAGRQATPAEIDELAHTLLPEVGEVTIVAEERHEIDASLEISLHQVRIEVDASGADEAERLVQLAEEWALRCAQARHPV